MSDVHDSDNATAIEAWNTVLFEKFCRFRYVLTDGLSVHSDELFRRKPFRAGGRVLDIGCGFGDTAQRIARHVTAGGEVVGVDCAQGFVGHKYSDRLNRVLPLNDHPEADSLAFVVRCSLAT